MTDGTETQRPPHTAIVVPEGGLDFVSPSGRLLMRLAEDPEFGTFLQIHSPDGRDTLSLYASEDGLGVVLADPARGAAAGLSTWPDGASVDAVGPDGTYAGLTADDLGADMTLRRPGGGIGAFASATRLGGTWSVLPRPFRPE